MRPRKPLSTADKTEQDIAFTFVDTQDEAFQGYLMAAITHDREFYDIVSPVLCQFNGEELEDFSVKVYNGLFFALHNYRTLLGSAGGADIPDSGFLATMLNIYAGQAKFLDFDQVPQAVAVFEEIARTPFNPAIGTLVRAGWGRWLEKRRVKFAASRHFGMDDWDVSALMERIQIQTSAIRARHQHSNDVYCMGDWEGMDESPLTIMPTGITGLDRAMSGGPARGEATLGIAAQGSGKTVLACHLAGYWAKHNFKGVFITTEQPGKFLEPRIISNFCNIPFSRINRGIRYDQMTELQRKSYEDVRSSIGKNMMFVHWKASDNKTIRADLHQTLEFVGEQLGGLDFVVLDWLSPSVVGIKTEEQAQYGRHLWQMSADYYAAATEQYKIVSWLFAQANMLQSRNKAQVDASMASECKGLSQNMHNGVGMSAMLDPNAVVTAHGEEVDNFAEKQYLNIFKCRLGTPRCIPFKREYNYQRIGQPLR